MDGPLFHGRDLTDGIWIDVYHVDYGDIMHGYWYFRYETIIDGSQFHNNIENNEDGYRYGSPKLEPYHIVPSYSSNDAKYFHIPYIIVSLQVPGALLLSSFILKPAIAKAGASASGDNATFGVRKKYCTIYESKNFIPHASAHANQSVHSDIMDLAVNLNNTYQGYLLMVIIWWNPRRSS